MIAHRIYSFVVIWLLSVMLSLGCGGAAREEPEIRAWRLEHESVVAVAYTKGMFQVGLTLVVLQDNTVVLNAFAPEERSVRLSPDEADRLAKFLGSSVFKDALQELDSSSYKPGRTDLPEVELEHAGKRYGFPVCSRGPLVAAPVRTTVDWFNEFGVKHFGDLFSQMPTRTCRPGFTTEDL